MTIKENEKEVRSYLDSLESDTLRYLLNVPKNKWIYGLYKAEFNSNPDLHERCMVGHVDLHLKRERSLSVGVFSNVELRFDGLCVALGLEAGVKIVKWMCEDILKIRGEGTVDL